MKTVTAIVVFALIVVMPVNSLVEFASDNWLRSGHVRIEDAYKWLYQATRGGEHAVPSEAGAREWLNQEWASLGEPLPGEPLWEPLRPDERIGRLNLRPFRMCGGNQEDLLAAFLESAKAFKGTEDDFRTAWHDLGLQLSKKSSGKLTRSDWERLDNQMRTKSYPAVHHSRAYDEAHHPAYRVLTGSAAKSLMTKAPRCTRALE